MSSKLFSFRRAIDNDFNLTLTILIPCFLWGIYLLTIVIAGGSPLIFYISLAATLLSPFYLVWRLRKIRLHIETGEEATGKITKIYFDGDHGRIQYIYIYAGENYKGSAAIHRNDLTRSFKDGQPIDLVIDRDHPERSFLLDLYAKKTNGD